MTETIDHRPARKQRVIIDITDILSYFRANRQVTGIQRVVRNISRHLVDMPQYEIVFTCITHPQNKICRITDPRILWDVDALLPWIKKSGFRAHKRNIAKYQGRPLKKSFHQAMTYLLQFYYIMLHRRNISDFEFEEGDIYLFMGIGWSSEKAVENIISNIRGKNVSIYFLIHDLIPLRYGDFDDTFAKKQFAAWLEQSGSVASGYLVPSQFTKSDLQAYLAEQNNADIPISHFPLAHEFSYNSQEHIRENIGKLAQQRYVVCVSPRAKRKNIDRLIDVWSALKAEIGDEKLPWLILVGGKGTIETPADEIFTDPAAPISFANVNDSELDFLYRHSLFSVFPSLYEGWGLPIGESLWCGRLCATSNVTSMPEVGGALCDYFDPNDSGSMAATLKRLILDDDYLKARQAEIDHGSLRDWSDTANLLCNALKELEEKRTRA